MESLVSVIVPFYNAEKSLAACLNSIGEQNFKGDYEVILINDGSTDRSLDIAKRFSEKYPFFKIFSQSNNGVSAARNLGISKSKSKFICFVDADDIVLPNYILDLYKLRLEVDRPALVIQTYQGRDSFSLSVRNNNLRSSKKNKARLFLELELLNKSSGPCAKLYDRSIITANKIEFPVDLSIGEDGCFILDYIISSEMFIASENSNYIVNDSGLSLSRRFHGFSNEQKCFIFWKDRLLNLCQQVENITLNEQNYFIWTNGQRPFFRTLHSIYKDDKWKSILFPALFKNIDYDFLRFIKSYYKPQSIGHKLFKFLIINKLIRIFCFLGCLRDILNK